MGREVAHCGPFGGRRGRTAGPGAAGPAGAAGGRGPRRLRRPTSVSRWLGKVGLVPANPRVSACSSDY